MIATALLFAALQIDKDQPHRDWGQVLTLSMTAEEATTCVARTMQKKGPTLALPQEGGSDIDFTPGGFLGWGQPEAWLRFKVRNESGKTTMHTFYKHPLNTKTVSKYVRILQRQCLRIEATQPS